MVVSLLPLALHAQGSGIGEIPKGQFLQLLDRAGFGAAPNLSPYQATFASGHTRAFLVLQFGAKGVGAPVFVGRATARLEFDLPHSLGKAWIENWRKSEKLERFEVHSFLGGRVVLQSQIMTPADSLDTVISNSNQFFAACQALKLKLAAMGGKPARDINQVGSVPLEPKFKLDFVEREDMDYLRVRLKWGNEVKASGSGWITGAEPLGVPVVFNGMNAWKGLTLTCMAKPDPQKAAIFLAHPSPIDWADGSVGLQSVYIQKTLELDQGITVAELCDKILEFARHIKRLDVLPLADDRSKG